MAGFNNFTVRSAEPVRRYCPLPEENARAWIGALWAVMRTGESGNMDADITSLGDGIDPEDVCSPALDSAHFDRGADLK